MSSRFIFLCLVVVKKDDRRVTLEVVPCLLALGKYNGLVWTNHFSFPEQQRLVVVAFVLERKEHLPWKTQYG